MSQEKPVLIWWKEYGEPCRVGIDAIIEGAGIHQPFLCTKQDDVDYFKALFLLAGKDIIVLSTGESNPTDLPVTYLELDLSS